MQNNKHLIHLIILLLNYRQVEATIAQIHRKYMEAKADKMPTKLSISRYEGYFNIYIYDYHIQINLEIGLLQQKCCKISLVKSKISVV